MEDNEPTKEGRSSKTDKDGATKRRHNTDAEVLSIKLTKIDATKLSKVLPLECMAMKESLCQEPFVLHFHTHWLHNTTMECHTTNTVVHQNPFKICVMQQFLQVPEIISHLVHEMSTDDWTRKQMDLYEFYQTNDLSNTSCESFQYLHAFYTNLKDNVRPWMEKLTGMSLTHVSASCSMYNCGDHLLVHDDLLSDRRIAYVFYLSPWLEEWTSEMGGALEVFPCDDRGKPYYPIAKALLPRNNQFIFFEVCDKSFHQVGEVTNLVYPRLTINGWFHGPNPKETSSRKPLVKEIEAESNFQSPNTEPIDLTEWINENYLHRKIRKSIQEQIEENSEASLELFLISEFFDLLTEQMKSQDEVEWTHRGPANQRKYDSLCVSSCRGPIKDLIKLFLSPAMFQLLFEYTELDLAGPGARQPQCSIDIIRVTQSSYSLLGDSSTFANSSLDVIMFFNASDASEMGVITYLNPHGRSGEVRDDSSEKSEDGSSSSASDDDEDNSKNDTNSTNGKDGVLLSICPKNNALNMVYRSQGTAKFLKYISKNVIGADGYVYILIASYKE